MNYIKSISRISKSKINTILSAFTTDVEVIEKIVKRDEIYYNISKNNMLNSYDIEDKSEKEYEFKYKFNGIYTEKFSVKLSKSAIKQYLYIHFIPANKSGVRKGISISDIANRLGISYVAAKNNFDLLKKVGLIWMHKNGRNSYDVTIVDEYKMHNENKGYITLSSYDLKHLCSFDNVNELKVELKKYLWADARSKMGEYISFNKNNIFKVLPAYIPFPEKEKILKNEKSIFAFNGKTLDLAAYETTESKRELFHAYFKKIIESFFSNSGIHYSFNIEKAIMNNKENSPEIKAEKILIVKDICDLAIQYSLNHVMKALNILKDRVEEIGYMDIKNTAAYLRSLIDMDIATN